ncbi:MAG TPA: DUF2079 domain-containing protein [Dehalococcoidia bacterium]|nr:DUF2079 domain-containing protein [Dehalococcoidia bacterium]
MQHSLGTRLIVTPSLPLLVAMAAAAAYALAGVLAHASYHSFGWDLGVFDQVLWSIAHGDWFYYSFRPMPYLGDHFQPVLVLLAPLALLGLGAAPLLVVQGVALGAAVLPLHAAARRLAGPRAAWGLVLAYVLSLAVARAIALDFHPECFVPLLAFTSFWALTSGRNIVFAGAVLALLPLKEDMAFLSLALCWLAWIGFGQRSLPATLAVLSVAYWVAAVLYLMPHAGRGGSNPLLERYAYLGASPREITTNAILRPDLIVEHLARPEALGAVLLLLAGVGFLPLLRPRLLPPLAFLVAVPLLSVNHYQQELKLHYGLVPYTYAAIVAAVALQGHPFAATVGRLRRALFHTYASGAAPICLALTSAALFVWLSPLPPSFTTVLDHFHVDRHAAIAGEVLETIPGDAAVSAQANFVPHLSERTNIFEFPRIEQATFVILDGNRDVPEYDVAEFQRCSDALPDLGFSLHAAEDGIELWTRSPDDARRFGGLDCG